MTRTAWALVRMSSAVDRIMPAVRMAGTPSGRDATNNSDVAIAERDEVWYLRLHVAGQSPKSLHALTNLNNLCEKHLAGHYEIEIIDLVEHPSLARGDEILAIPTLVRRVPEPFRKVIGDLSNTESVLVGLQLQPKSPR